MKKRLWLGIVVIFTVFLTLNTISHLGHASSPSNSIILTDSQGEYSLIPYLEVLADPDQNLTFSQVSSSEYKNAFQSSSDFDHSIESTTYWIRFNLANQAKNEAAWLLLYDNYRINYISTYLPEPSTGDYRAIHTGNALPFSSRDYEHHYFAFWLNIPKDTQQTVYMRMSDIGGISFEPLKIQSLTNFTQLALREQFWSGAYYASILTIALYTIFFVFSLNDRNFLSFFLLLLTVLISSLSSDGIGHQLVWPNWTAWTKISTASSILIYLAAFLHYTLISLETRKHFPLLAKISNATVIGLFIILIIRLIPALNSSFVTPAFVILLIFGFFLPIFLAFYSLKIQRQQAQFFLLAFSAYLVIVIIAILGEVTGRDIISNKTLTRIGFTWILLVFSISTNIKINRIRNERIQAKDQLLREQQEALQLQIQLTEVLQKSRDDIVEAYDTTLEGWAQLLELRDKETEGHSRNVVELTLRFAKQVGISDDELVHIRRGAMLHDIGKIAIPDSILLKPGPLTDEEWEIMRQHPVFALKFLSGIPYLEKALDIPAYHHERWDGNGYAHKLKEEDIPLSARIFTVVDNWDALLSDRPYRKAWPTPKVKKYLIENAGQIFDPNLVQIFLNEIA